MTRGRKEMSVSVINWQQCRKFMLEYSARTRHEAYVHARVSRPDIEPLLENALREAMRKIVDSQPSKGKTIMAP